MSGTLGQHSDAELHAVHTRSGGRYAVLGRARLITPAPVHEGDALIIGRDATGTLTAHTSTSAAVICGLHGPLSAIRVEASDGPLNDGDEVIVYHGKDGRGWGRAEREFARKFKEKNLNAELPSSAARLDLCRAAVRRRGHPSPPRGSEATMTQPTVQHPAQTSTTTIERLSVTGRSGLSVRHEMDVPASDVEHTIMHLSDRDPEIYGHTDAFWTPLDNGRMALVLTGGLSGELTVYRPVRLPPMVDARPLAAALASTYQVSLQPFDTDLNAVASLENQLGDIEFAVYAACLRRRVHLSGSGRPETASARVRAQALMDAAQGRILRPAPIHTPAQADLNALQDRPSSTSGSQQPFSESLP